MNDPVLWIWLALGMALCNALTPLISEYFKVKALHMLFWMRGFGLLVFLPVPLFLPWPQDPWFYFFIAATSLGAVYYDLLYFGLAARNGAGIMTRISPLLTPLAFVLWVMIRPQMLSDYAASPVRTAGILAAMAGAVYFSLRLRACPLSWSSLRGFIPALAVGCGIIVMGKLAMDHSPFHSGVFYYPLVQSVITLTIYLVMVLFPRYFTKIPTLELDSRLGEKRVLQAGLCMGLVWSMAMIFKYYAFALVENPAYVSLVDLTVPLWVLLAYRLAGRREKADIISGLGIVACAALLVMSTRL